MTTPIHRRRWPYWLAAFLVLSLAGGAAYVVYRTPVLGLAQVEVSATTGDLSEQVNEDVKDAVEVSDGTPLVTVDLAAVRARVLALPQIATAAVSRHWPNALVVTVTQRVPAAVTVANGSNWLLDTTGHPYLEVTRAPAGLLTVQLATPGAADPSTVAALAVIGALKAPIRATVASLTVRSAYSVVLNLKDGRTVIWGSPDDSARKMQVLPAVLAQPGRVYDISDPTYVTVSAG